LPKDKKINTNLLLKTLELYNPKNNKKRFGRKEYGGYVIIKHFAGIQPRRVKEWM
jgi:hypothetical protein